MREIPFVNVGTGSMSGWKLKWRFDREFIHLDLHWTDKVDPTHTAVVKLQDLQDLKDYLND